MAWLLNVTVFLLFKN